VAKDDKPDRGPKKFADNPNDFKPRAKLKTTFNGDVPKGWGPSAKGVTPIAKEAGPDAFKKHGQFGGPNNEQANRNDEDRDNDKGKGEASKGFGGPGGPNQFNEGNRDLDDRGGGDQGKPKGFGGQAGSGGPGGRGQGGRQGGQQAEGQGGGGGDKDKCTKHPEKPGCQNQN
jgi:hypothetical protein